MKHLVDRTKGWGHTYLQTEQDVLWFNEGLDCGYRLPPPAPRWKRLWGPRHWRWFWAWVRLEIDAVTYAELGVKLPGCRGWVLYAIGRGWV